MSSCTAQAEKRIWRPGSLPEMSTLIKVVGREGDAGKTVSPPSAPRTPSRISFPPSPALPPPHTGGFCVASLPSGFFNSYHSLSFFPSLG